ncbi:MAG: enoyl-CoA hydratase-related protein [Candidatus Binatia bacterium]|nr:enoyl-CoA hydratase-related protein [Candidatus Binatia bacterium]
MTEFGVFGDVRVELGENYVATVELRRGPNNFFDITLITSIGDAFEALDGEPGCRAIVLCSDGKHFCAGANFGNDDQGLEDPSGRHLYDEAVRLFSTKTPAVAAVQGAAIGGGLGLALMPDFRVASPESRFSANFARLGFHQGFGLSVTLPDLVGQQRAMELLYVGRRVPGKEAFAMGLCDRLVPADQIRSEATALAAEIATSGPLAIESIRQTLRGSLAQRIRVVTDREKAEQNRLQSTEDFREGIRAMADRRKPDFKGR